MVRKQVVRGDRRPRGERPGYAASGFFVLRTPLLPFAELRAWGEGLRAPATIGEAERLEVALDADRTMLRERLLAAWRRPAVREAVYLASPELDAALERIAQGDLAEKAIRGLVVYFARMAGRSTPFGLFAGCSTGTLDYQTQLELPAGSTYTRQTRLDAELLSTLVGALETDPSLRPTLRFRPNSGLYRAGGRLHYAQARLDRGSRSYHLVAVEETPELRRTLERAAAGVLLSDLAATLVTREIGLDDARQFVEELATSQVLVSDLGPDLTGDGAIHGLIARLSESPETEAVRACLEQVRDALMEIDRNGVGGNTQSRYAEVRSSLDRLGLQTDPARLFQVDMVKPATELTLGPALQAELARGLELLQRLPSTADPDTSALQRFVERFMARYEGAEVPLVEALDEEIGIGFETQADPGGEPLLRGLDRPAVISAEPRAWSAYDELRLRLLTEAVGRGEQTIELQMADLEACASPDPLPPLPDAFAVSARLAASSAEAVDRGDFRLWLQGASGPSGARLLGRFCHADAELHRRVVEHLRAEEAHRPDAVFAEILHLPEGRLGNILSRPTLRDYEIPFLGQSGVAGQRQIPVTDLRVSARGGRIVLRSERLDREVVPRLTTAHNFGLRSLGLYRFLCALQQQGSRSWLGWSWGPFDRAPFVPRLVSGRLVLARACWNLSAAELRPLVAADGGAMQFAAVQALRAARRLPRYVAVADGDNELAIDLDNVLSVEAFLHLVKGRDAARLVELFPGPDELCVVGPEGRYTSELIVPFVKVPAPLGTEYEPRPKTRADCPAAPRRFPPGSEWLYAKLYTGYAVADRLLVDVVRPVVDAALQRGAADSWFFIRYADSSSATPHVRLRLHGDPNRLAAEVLPSLASALAPLVDDGRVARWQLDTYVREVERYGGNRGILLAERLFGVDSECVLDILEQTPGDAAWGDR
jgi:hypothetical protein